MICLKRFCRSVHSQIEMGDAKPYTVSRRTAHLGVAHECRPPMFAERRGLAFTTPASAVAIPNRLYTSSISARTVPKADGFCPTAQQSDEAVPNDV